MRSKAAKEAVVSSSDEPKVTPLVKSQVFKIPRELVELMYADTELFDELYSQCTTLYGQSWSARAWKGERTGRRQVSPRQE